MAECQTQLKGKRQVPTRPGLLRNDADAAVSTESTYSLAEGIKDASKTPKVN